MDPTFRLRHTMRDSTQADDGYGRAIPVSFYKSVKWQKVRTEYLAVHPYCERCLAAGMITPAEHVHHIIHLTMDNYMDPAIAYGADNLESLCASCHAIEHHGAKDCRDGLQFDKDGNLVETKTKSETE